MNTKNAQVKAIERAWPFPFGAVPFGAVPFASVALLAALLTASCGGQQQDEQAAGEDGPATLRTAAQLTEEPEEYYGEQVTVSGIVSERVGPNALAIGGDDTFGGDRLLVAGVQRLNTIVQGDAEEAQAGDLVQATGTLREFEEGEIGNQVDYGIDNEYFGDYEGEPAVLATSVVVTPREEG